MARRTRTSTRISTPASARTGSATPPRAPRGHAGVLLAAGLAVASLTTAAVVTMRGTRREPVDPGSRAPVATLASAATGDPEPLAPKGTADAEIDLVQQRAVLAALGQAGIDGESLAAAGVTPQQATAIGAAVAQDIEILGAALDAATGNVLSSEQQADSLERLLIAGVATQEQIGELALARTRLAGALATREAALEAVWATATEPLEPQTIARLDHLRTTWHRPLPTNLRALTYQPEQWSSLENAYTSVRVADALEIDRDPAAVAILTNAQGQSAATTAAGWLASNLSTVQINLAAAAGQ